MTRSRRACAAAAAGAAAVTLAASAAAQDAPVTADGIRASITTIEVEASVKAIRIRRSVEALEVERRAGDGVTVTVASDVLFEFDRASLTPEAEVTIERIARRNRSARGPVRVEGHTDSLGSAAYNLRLSRRRAATVSRALRGALPGVAIRARGVGEADPVAPNTRGGDDNPAGRARNRRVTISFPR
jgi:outer membrane protein OmpA-like peptidoglycan-associated protein